MCGMLSRHIKKCVTLGKKLKRANRSGACRTNRKEWLTQSPSLKESIKLQSLRAVGHSPRVGYLGSWTEIPDRGRERLETGIIEAPARLIVAGKLRLFTKWPGPFSTNLVPLAKRSPERRQSDRELLFTLRRKLFTTTI